jgi:alpha-beta hydrolase superfamily lysophospholipase
MKDISEKFAGRGSLGLYYEGYLPTGSPKAVLLIVHGLAEHFGRYASVADHFVSGGYAVYGFDQRGHGWSEGLRGYVERFSHYTDDLQTFFGMVRVNHPGEKIFLIGHSVGGMIALAYCIDHQNEIDGLILSGATIGPGNSLSATKIRLARLLSSITPKLGVNVIDSSAISQDQAVVEAYKRDPLAYRGKIRARLGAELIRAMQDLPDQMSRIWLPVLVMSGSADRPSNPEGSRLVYERVSSKDKTLRIYDGFFHEILNEPGRGQVLSDTDDWLASRLQTFER